MRTPAIIFVDTNNTGTGRQAIRVASGLGYHPVLLSPDPHRHAWAITEGSEILAQETWDDESVLAACRACGSRMRVCAVTSLSDRRIAAAAACALAMGLHGPDPAAIRRAGDKVFQQQVFGAAGIPSPQWCIARSASEATAAVACLGLPVVVKPTHGSGSVGVRLADSRRAVKEIIECLTRGTLSGRAEEQVIIEQYIDGPQCSVELFGGSPVGVTWNHIGAPPTFIETGHDYPAPLADTTRAAVTDAAMSAARALGADWGPAHVEVRLAIDGPRVIEVNPRLAGGMIPELVRLATGVDLVAATLRACLGLPVVLDGTCWRAASLRSLVVPGRGRLRDVLGVELLGPYGEAVRFHQIREPGETIGGFGDFRDRAACVIAVGNRVEESAALAEAAALQLRVTVDSTGFAEASP